MRAGIFLITSVDVGDATDGGDRITAVNLTRRIEPDELPPQLLRVSQKLSEETVLPEPEADEQQNDAADGEKGGEAREGGSGGSGESSGEGGSGGGGGASTDTLASAAAVSVTLAHYLGGPCLAFRPTALALLREPAHADVAATLAVTDHVTLGPAPGGEGGEGGGTDGWEDGGRWISGDLSVVCALVRRETARRGATSASVRVIWGDARWSRAQLLGEIARGHWGMCTAAVHDVFSEEGGRAQWGELVTSANERIVYAPRSEMTEEIDDDEEGEEGEEGEGGEESEEREGDGGGDEDEDMDEDPRT